MSDKVKVYIELPETEEGLINLDDLNWSTSLGSKVRKAVHNEIQKFLVEKYQDKELEFDWDEIKKQVKDRIVDKLAERAMDRMFDYE